MRRTGKQGSVAGTAGLAKAALDNVGSEIGGTILAPATGALTGAGLGALVAAIRGKDVRGGAGAGALAGYAGGHLGNLAGVIAGVIRRRRTREEQQEHDSKSHWENLIPGVGSYNSTKRTGRVLEDAGRRDEKTKKAAEAQRSQLRRATLTKAAQLDASRILGALSIATGSALGGSAAFNGEQSLMKRIGKGTLGAGLTYAGYKALTDPDWQDGIHHGLSKLTTFIKGLLGKRAEHAISPEDAYLDGFCKAAATAGVDPVSLCKSAAMPRWMGSAASAGGRMLRRFGRLLANGDRARLAPHVRRLEHMRTLAQPTVEGAEAVSGGPRLLDRVREYWRTLSGAHVRHGEAQVKNLLASKGIPEMEHLTSAYLPEYMAKLMQEQAATSELRKALATQVGTAGAGLYGLSKLFGGKKEPPPKKSFLEYFLGK